MSLNMSVMYATQIGQMIGMMCQGIGMSAGMITMTIGHLGKFLGELVGTIPVPERRIGPQGEDMGPLTEPEKEQKRLQIRIWRYILGGALGTVSLYYFYKWFLKRRNPLLEAFIEQELRLKGPRSQDISYEQRMQIDKRWKRRTLATAKVVENMAIMAVAVAMVDHATEEVWVHMEVVVFYAQ